LSSPLSPESPSLSIESASAEDSPHPRLTLARDVRQRSAPRLDPVSLAVLEDATKSADPDTRILAIEAVADARVPELVEWLGHALGDPEHDVRVTAVEGLTRLATPRAHDLLVSVRDDKTEDLDVRALAASALLVSP
jgi:HEAT repeat protein